MLSAGAAGPVGIDLQVLLVDLDLHVILDHGAYLNGSKAGVAALGRVEGGDAHQAVYAALCREQAVGVLTVETHGGALDARFSAAGRLVELDPEAPAVSPAKVHAQQHLGPVLRLGAASARVDSQNGVAVIVFAAEQAFFFQLREVRKCLGEGV